MRGGLSRKYRGLYYVNGREFMKTSQIVRCDDNYRVYIHIAAAAYCNMSSRLRTASER